MKKIAEYIKYSILFAFCQVVLFAAPTYAGTQDFYFDSFSADYYLEHDEKGISTMRVVEQLVAVFPDFDQNKGICRMIPFTNKGGQNVTLKNLNSNNIKVLRNGQRESIYSINKETSYYEVCTGTNEYIRGIQTFTFEYSFENVVTSFSENNKTWQELYWNTNGTGWKQQFRHLVARIHLDKESKWTGDAWCYVGSYGENGSDRCRILSANDVIEFSANNLAAGENLTFDIELENGSFIVAEPEKNYIAFVIVGVVVLICLFIIGFFNTKFAKTKEQRKFYKGYFVKPEYAPSNKYSLVELAQTYIGKRKDEKVALLLDMIVKGKINLVDTGNQKKWNIQIVNLSGVSREEEIILEILNDAAPVKEGDTIEVKSRSASSALHSLGREFEQVGLKKAKEDKLIKKVKTSFSSGNGVIVFFIIMAVFVYLPVFPTITLVITSLAKMSDAGNFWTSSYLNKGVLYVGLYPCIVLTIVAIITTISICAILRSKYHKVENYELAGLEASRFMDGLKLFITKTETDRLAFLQSVNTADMSSQGIVKLYEKLLPYAALFGVEETWMEELSKYYELPDVEAPTWYSSTDFISAHSFNKALQTVSSAASSSIHYESSSYSGGSSFSGGGGGGFSGGGGGGGGGGGR